MRSAINPQEKFSFHMMFVDGDFESLNENAKPGRSLLRTSNVNKIAPVFLKNS